MEQQNPRINELEYGITKFNSKTESLKNKSSKYGFVRLAVFFSGLAWFVFTVFFLDSLIVWLSLAAWLIIFGFLTAVHNKIDYEIKKCRIWLEIKKENLARIKIDWQHIPGKDYNEPETGHPFENDLSITGKNSLLRLIDVSASDEGREKLKEWLLTRIPSVEVILERQELVRELIPLQRFRNKLILNSSLAAKKKLEGTVISAWLKSELNILKLKKILSVLRLIIPINVLLLILFFLEIIPAYWTIGALIYISIYWFNSKHISELFEVVTEIKGEFGKFSRILEFLEKYNYGKNHLLKEFCRIFYESKKSPSYYFKRLNRLTYAASLQKYPVTMLLLNSLFPYDFYLAYKMELIKNELKELLPVWLDKFYNLEALISLSDFAYLNPGYTFPLIKKEKSGLLFITENIVHPFIPAAENIPNNFSISESGEVAIITGSNMSGKSTFLKSMGINLALCYAGGVVCASKFEAYPFRLFTCIKVTDSVSEGISYFYAEVKRLKELLEELNDQKQVPVFYLIDEIFRGTNNLERLIGSRSYIKMIAGLNGSGLISTHDLELVKLEKEIPKVRNYHFKEEVSDGKMIFDYKLRTGPSPTTNALKIMEIEGLPVERGEE